MTEPGNRMSVGLDTALDLFGKVERDQAAVQRQVTPDVVFNFVVTAHALCDWIQKDPTLPAATKEAAAELAKTNEWLRACRDLANGSKHFSIDRYQPMVEHADASTGYGRGRFGVGPYGVGEWSIKVSWGGATYQALDLVVQVYEVWATFFRQHASQDAGTAA